MLSFTSAPGNLFPRWGKLGLLLSQVRIYQLAQLTNMTDTVNGVVAQYNGESDIQALMGSNYLSSLQAPESVCTTAQTIAEQTVNRMVFRDNPQLSQTLTQLNTLNSLLEVIRQMKIAGATVLAPTIGVTYSSTLLGNFTGTGNGLINISLKRPLDGRTLENSFAESLLFTCTNDSYSGSATAGNETFQLTGTGTETDYYAFDWPLGSNASQQISAIDGDTSNGDGNILTNSNFNLGSNNLPTNWTATTGTAGTDFALNATITYGNSSHSLQLLGTGVQVDLRQTPTSGTFNAITQYGVGVFLRQSGSPTGTVQIQLVDGNGTVITDAAGNQNTFTITVASLTTGFVGFIGQFRTPDILPSTISVRILSTVTGGSVYVAKLSLGLMTQAYTSGPFGCVHAGSIPFAAGDYATAAITNSRGSGGTLNTFQTLLSRLFPVQVLGQELLFPSASNASIPDTLIG